MARGLAYEFVYHIFNRGNGRKVAREFGLKSTPLLPFHRKFIRGERDGNF